MAVQPYADPGYGMPNAYVGNLNQAPGMAVGGYLPANALQPGDPNADNPLAQAPRQPWSQFDKDEDQVPGAAAPTPGMSQLDLWLADQRAKNAANQYELLPGITSGAPREANALWPGSMQLAGDVVPLPLNDPSNFAQPDRMPDTRAQPWDANDWARQLFILPANDPGRRQRPNTQG